MNWYGGSNCWRDITGRNLMDDNIIWRSLLELLGVKPADPKCQDRTETARMFNKQIDKLRKMSSHFACQLLMFPSLKLPLVPTTSGQVYGCSLYCRRVAMVYWSRCTVSYPCMLLISGSTGNTIRMQIPQCITQASSNQQLGQTAFCV